MKKFASVGGVILFFLSSAFASEGLWKPLLNFDAPQKHVTVVFDSVTGCDSVETGRGRWPYGTACYPGQYFADEYLLIRITDVGMNFIADIVRGILQDPSILAFADALIKSFADQDTQPITPAQINGANIGNPIAPWNCRTNMSPTGSTIPACDGKQICVDRNDDPAVYYDVSAGGWGNNGVYFEYICGYDPWAPYNGPGAPSGATDALTTGNGMFNMCLAIPGLYDVCLNLAIADVNDLPGVNAWHPDLDDAISSITERVIYWNPSQVTAEIYGDQGSKCNQYKIDRDGDGFVDTDIACDNWPHSHDDSLQLAVSISNAVIDVVLDWWPKANQAACQVFNLDVNGVGCASFVGAVSDYCTYYEGATSYDEDCNIQNEMQIPVSYYDPSTDASQYVKAVAGVRLNQIRLELGLRVIAEYDDSPNELTMHTRTIGINLQNLRVDTGAYLDLYTGHVTSGDPAWKTTDDIDHILQYVEADIVMAAVDAFTAPITFYFGPNPIIDIGDFVGNLTFQHPLNDNPPTWITLDIGLQSFQESITVKNTNLDRIYDYDFFADIYGVVMPLQFGIDLIHVDQNGAEIGNYVPRATNYYMTTGISGVTCPIADMEYGPVVAMLRHYPTADDIDDSAQPNSFPVPLSWNMTPRGWQAGQYFNAVSYHIGIALHMNPLSRVIYDAARNGILCLWISEDTPLLGSFIGGFLTTGNFAFLMPELEDAFPGSPMALEVRPWFYNPRNIDNYPYTGSPYPDDPARIVDTPRVYTGGRISIDALYDTAGGIPRDPQTQRWAMTTPAADITIDIPHLEIGFWVWDKTGNNWMRAFSLDLATRLGIDINTWPCPVSTDTDPPYAPSYTNPDIFIWNWNNPDQLICYPNPYTVDAPNGTSGTVLRYQWVDGTYYNFSSAFVFDLRAFIDPNVNWFIRYAQAFTRQPIDYNPADNSNPPYSELKKLENILGNLLPVLLDGMIEVNLSVALDLGYLLKAPFGLIIPYFGPRTDMSLFPYSLTDPSLRGEDLNCTLDSGEGTLDAFNGGGAYCDNYLSRITSSLPGADAWSDYLEIYVKLIGTLTFKNIVTLLEEFANMSLADIVEGGGGGLGGLFGGAPPSHPYIRHISSIPDNLPPETIITSVPSRAKGDEVIISFTTIDDFTPPEGMRYSYSLDGGWWTIWTISNTQQLRLRDLTEGEHVVKIQALDEGGLMDPTPAVVRFRVDSLGPKLMLLNAPETVDSRSVSFAVYAKDAQAPDDKVLISYKLDSSPWTEFTPSRYITLKGLDRGLHRLYVRAIDDVGNESFISHTFTVLAEKSGFGCSTVNEGGSASTALLVLLLLAVYIPLRKRF